MGYWLLMPYLVQPVCLVEIPILGVINLLWRRVEEVRGLHTIGALFSAVNPTHTYDAAPTWPAKDELSKSMQTKWQVL